MVEYAVQLYQDNLAATITTAIIHHGGVLYG